MIIYERCSIYISSATDLRAKIARIDQVIDALTQMMIDMATAGADNVTQFSLAQYKIDDGQTKIEQNYRSAQEIEAAIYSIQRLKNIYINQLNGRVRRLVDGKNFVPWNTNNGFRN